MKALHPKMVHLEMVRRPSGVVKTIQWAKKVLGMAGLLHQQEEIQQREVQELHLLN
jgi:hypothetical protein